LSSRVEKNKNIGIILSLRRLPNGLISARRFEMAMDQYWQRHAGLSMANGW